MEERIEPLRGQIAKLHQLALSADPKGAEELHALAREMEEAVSEMEVRLTLTAQAGARRS